MLTVRQSARAKKVEDLIVEKQAMERTRARGECLCAEFKVLDEELDRIRVSEEIDALRKSRRRYWRVVHLLTGGASTSRASWADDGANQTTVS